MAFCRHLTKEHWFHAFIQLECKSVVIPPDNEDIRHCIHIIDKPQQATENISVDQIEMCRSYRLPIVQQNEIKTNIHRVIFARKKIFMNSACLASEQSMKNICVKGSHVSISDIIHRHNYDKYSLSTLFKFDHLLTQQDPCMENYNMFTFLVSAYCPL